MSTVATPSSAATAGNDDKLVLALPSKGRLMEQSAAAFAKAGLVVRKTGSERGYRGEIAGIPALEVAFVSSSEIVQQLKSGQVHLGVTGEDLVREAIHAAHERVEFLARLGFGFADVVVAVPQCWIDVMTMAQLQGLSPGFHRRHGRPLKVATKYMNLTRQFFARHGVTDYRIVESLGATEGTPGSGAADLIVDITTTGSTLKANALRVLADGVILKSEANLIASTAAAWSPAKRATCDALVAHFKRT